MTSEPGVLNLIVQGGSFALLAWVFVYWIPRIATAIGGELAKNREAIDSIVDRTLLERKEDRDARHALAERFNTSLVNMFLENAKQTERVTDAIRAQTDKLATKMDIVVSGLLQRNVEAADKLRKETDNRT